MLIVAGFRGINSESTGDIMSGSVDDFAGPH
jgi:hypothetical protein